MTTFQAAPHSHRIQMMILAAVLLAGTGCQTTIGNYFGNRARDFGECFATQVGVGIGLGVDLRAGGLVHVPVGGGFLLGRGTVGWAYGEVLPGKDDLFFIGFPVFILPFHGQLFFAPYAHEASLTPGEQHGCWYVLPAAFDFLELQEGGFFSDMERDETWAKVHAFDIDVTVLAVFLSARAGFSPGEFLDFLLGWFGIDIAEDDVGLEGSNEAPTDDSETPEEAGE